MVRRGLAAVLAFRIRSRLSSAGRAELPPAFTGLPPRLSSPAGRATPQPFPKGRVPAMTKRRDDIDLIPFVPSLSPVCRTADTILLFSVAAAGLFAAIAGVIGALT
ncbi:hypothetical protein KYK30_20375 [Shinella yambaruensis]|uniref:Uncharacterized protein n=1 Tax=Shinella yambaruensis TaxID=415996 RepID=A0ABQ5ZKJ4_9HYPH|nr:hypothetical protein [Shinella yambaruensis]MCJ8027050.1 hypothetical protein [Shinella yambaruensis]MCU7982059.1 hypothetical protein [Shinella yambaruensis]GLR51234.1 hypothetical protein GCM10007923_24420 [Shinella yambaruensis]